MGHTNDCPDRWEARRNGERAFERGEASFRNPYKSDWPDEGCPEAATEWQRAYREAERRDEERREEEHHQQMLAQQRQQEEAYYREMQEQEYYAEMEAQREEQEPTP